VRLRKVTLDLADFTLNPGIAYVAPVYTLQPGDWLFLAQIIITEAFNDTQAALGANAQVSVQGDASGVVLNAGGVSITPAAQSWTGGQAGLLNPEGGVDAETSGVIIPKLPMTPESGAVQLEVRIPLDGDGTTGQLVVLLWVAEF
jgi:hypothetical protein